jgi:formylglycine-generating enzyme required for sulfatase activity
MRETSADYIRIKAGDYCVGLDTAQIEALTFPSGGLKLSYLAASTPRHRVSLQACSLAAKLVTLDQFGEFIESTGYRTDADSDGWGWTWKERWMKREGLNWKRPFGNELDSIIWKRADRLPVLQVSWNDASAFCSWAGKRCGRNIYLPGEGEWEVAAEFIKATPVREQCGVMRIEEYVDLLIGLAGNGASMRGLVWEWTRDWYDAYPGGPCNSDFGRVYRVLRGGSLMSEPLQKHRAYRFRRCPTARSPFYGIRTCARDAGAPQ